MAKIITLRAIALKLVVHIHIQHVDNCEDHNATSYSTETSEGRRIGRPLCGEDHNATSYSTETFWRLFLVTLCGSEDHNATSYSTETYQCSRYLTLPAQAKIITLRAIALKPSQRPAFHPLAEGEDHNATSYSTETGIAAE